MFDTNPRSVLKIIAAITITLSTLSACTVPAPTKKEVSIEETRIVLPQALYDKEGFKLGKVTVYESGSLRHETVNFNSGWFAYTRYFRGGMLAVTPEKFSEEIADRFSEWEQLTPTETDNLNIGKIYATTVYNPKDDETCVFALGNVGVQIELMSGPGYPGRTSGIHCNTGKKPELLKEIMPLVRGIRLN